MILRRSIQNKIENDIRENEELFQNSPDTLKKKKAIIIYGPRQVGKTTLVKEILLKHPDNSQYINCELIYNKTALETTDDKALKSFLGDNKLIVLDEAQKIQNIGTVLKIIVDTFPEIQVIATGSSSFDLANKITEPLTGRSIKYMLYPLSIKEISEYINIHSEGDLEKILRFGLYPEVFNKPEENAISLIDDIASNYLFKDLFELENLKRSDIIHKLLQALAFQLGNEVSLHELSKLLKVNVNTIDRYLYLLEQSFVIFNLRSFSRNLRKELAKKYKIYFYDPGIRNSIIQNFNRLNLRDDVGALFENFCIIERLKYNQINNRYVNSYFWRTYDQQEIDYIEEYSGKLEGYEFKWNKKAQNYKPPGIFLKTYENSTVYLINKYNYHNFAIG